MLHGMPGRVTPEADKCNIRNYVGRQSGLDNADKALVTAHETE